MKKRCVVCGREFEAKSKRYILCSDECRRIRLNEGCRKKRALDRAERQGKEIKRAPVKLSFERIMEIARANNISYGKAVEYINSGRIVEKC